MEGGVLGGIAGGACVGGSGHDVAVAGAVGMMWRVARVMGRVRDRGG